MAAADARGAAVLMVTQNASLNAQESARKSQLEAWGHSVTTVVDSASQATIDSTVAAADIVYVPCTIDDWDLLYKLRTAAKGVVTETQGLDAEFGFATADGYTESRTQVFNLVNSHEVTSGLSSGTVTITSSTQNLSNNNNSFAAGMVKLAEGNWGGLGLGVMETGATLANTYSGNSTATARRVRLPWGWSFTFSALNSNGLTILRQAINWAVGKQLLAHWKLDESSGTLASDSSGNGRTGTVTGTASWTSAILNNGFSFNGSTKIQASAMMGNPRNISVAAWINLTTADSNGAEVISLGDHFQVRIDASGTSQVLFYNGSTWPTASVSQTFAGKGWHHIAATFDDDANSLKLYVNGVQVATHSTTSSISYSGLGTNTVIGRHGNSATTVDFTGRIDDVRVYNYALTATEVARLYGFLGHWKLIETSGTTATDSSPLATNGTYTNGVTLNAGGPYPGAGSKAASFDGTNDYVAVGSESNYDITDAITVAAWIKVTAFDKSYQTIIAKGDTSWRLARDVATNYLTYACSGLSTTKVVGATSVNDAVWHHVVGVYNGSTLRIYLDGKLDGSANATGSISTNNINLRIGENAEATGRQWEGLIHDVRVYNRALNAWEIAELQGMVGCWLLSETSGTTAADATLAANNGTYTGGVTLNTSGPQSGTIAAQFDGVNDYVSAPTSSDFSKGFSLAVWARPTAAGSGARFVDFGAGQDNNNLVLSRVSTGTTLEAAIYDGTGGSKTYVRTSSAIDLNVWRQYVVTLDSTGVAKLYRDNAEATISSGSSGYPNIGLPANARRASNYLARSNTGTDAYFQGQLCDVRIYNRPMSTTEISGHYNGGSFGGVRITKWIEVQ